MFNLCFHKNQVYYAFDKRYLESEKWVGVVLRNLPNNCTVDTIIKNFSKDLNDSILEVERLLMIKGQLCALIKVRHIEVAEKICMKWNRFSFGGASGQILKVHIHPLSYIKRETD